MEESFVDQHVARKNRLKLTSLRRICQLAMLYFNSFINVCALLYLYLGARQPYAITYYLG